MFVKVIMYNNKFKIVFKLIENINCTLLERNDGKIKNESSDENPK